MTRHELKRIAGSTVLVLLLVALLLGCQPAAPAATATPVARATVAAAPTQAPAAQATQAPVAPAPTQPAAAAPTAVPELLKLGVIAPVTGPAAASGIIAERFYRMAVDEVNVKGGIKVGGKTYRLEAITVDDQFTADGARLAANRLVLNEKVKFLYTMAGPGGVAGAQPVAEPAKVLILTSGAQDAQIGAQHPLTLQVGIGNERMRRTVLYDYLVKEYPNAKRVGFVGADDMNQRDALKIAEEYTKARNLNLVSREFYPRETKDFAPIVTRLLQQNPDALDMGSTGAYGPLFLGSLKALDEQKYKGIKFTSYSSLTAFTDAGSMAEGVVFPVIADWKASVVQSKTREVIEAYVQKHGTKDFNPGGYDTYNGVLVLAQAIEKAGTVDDTEKIAKVMRESKWNTAYGEVGFIGTQSLGLASVIDAPAYLSKFEGGKVITFDRKSAAHAQP